MTLLKTISIVLLTIFVINISLAQQAPDFTMDDVHGNSHSLYADYLDQGKTVFISIGAAWAGPSFNWGESEVMDEFYGQYVGSNAVLLVIESDPSTTLDNLYGIGTPNATVGDMITGHSYPIFNPETNFINTGFNVSYYPTIRIICPDGTMYSDEEYAEIGYGNFETAEDIANAMFQKCGTTFELNQLNVDVFNDQSLDCIYDMAEIGVENIKVTVDNGTSSFSKFTDVDGKISLLMQSGDYELSIDKPSALWTSCNNPQTINFPNSDEILDTEVGLQALEDCVSFSTSIATNILRRCFESNLYVNYCNNGTITSVGTFVSVTLPDSVSFVASNYPDFTIQNQTITFDIGAVPALECGKITITVFPHCDMELGGEVCISSLVFPDDDCDSYEINFDENCDIIVGSYDPNDKRAFPYFGSDTYPVLPDGEIDYQIRFQNTGNDTAFTVVIVDVISENLDLSSFKKGVCSHDCEIEINDGREIRFTFNDILLPDSTTNELASNGFVTFTIDMVAGLQEGELMENTADIFFDFNDAVVTNTTTHVIDLGITSTADLDFESKTFSLAPNPAKNDLRITTTNDNYSKVIITDIKGLLVGNYEMKNKEVIINTHEFSTGIYFVRLKNENGYSNTEKLIIMD